MRAKDIFAAANCPLTVVCLCNTTIGRTKPSLEFGWLADLLSIGRNIKEQRDTTKWPNVNFNSQFSSFHQFKPHGRWILLAWATLLNFSLLWPIDRRSDRSGQSIGACPRANHCARRPAQRLPCHDFLRDEIDPDESEPELTDSPKGGRICINNI